MKKMLKKLKKSWNENRVLFVLTTVLVICIIVIMIVMANYFFGSTKDKYGDRLDGIKKVVITDKRNKELTSKILEDETITKADVNQIGKILYINMELTEAISLVEAEGKALNILTYLSEAEAEFYDVNFSLYQSKTENSDGYSIMGSKNVNGTGLIWNNNTPVSVD